MVQLNDNVGAHIRTNAYKYDKLISQELVRIQRVKDIQWRSVTLVGSALISIMIGTVNLFSKLYYDELTSGEYSLENNSTIEAENNAGLRWLESGDSRLPVLLPVGAVAGLLLLLLCCCACYQCRSRVRAGARVRGK